MIGHFLAAMYVQRKYREMVGSMNVPLDDLWAALMVE